MTVAATDPDASEPGSDVGTFTVTRTGGATGAPLIVNYSISGTAQPDTDYVALSGNVVIPAEATSAPIALAPLDDFLAESNERCDRPRT